MKVELLSDRAAIWMGCDPGSLMDLLCMAMRKLEPEAAVKFQTSRTRVLLIPSTTTVGSTGFLVKWKDSEIT